MSRTHLAIGAAMYVSQETLQDILILEKSEETDSHSRLVWTKLTAWRKAEIVVTAADELFIDVHTPTVFGGATLKRG